jgi:hypothetical protein
MRVGEVEVGVLAEDIVRGLADAVSRVSCTTFWARGWKREGESEVRADLLSMYW